MGGGWGPRRPSRVSLLRQYLDRIGQLFFGVPPKQASSYGGLLGKARGAGRGGRGVEGGATEGRLPASLFAPPRRLTTREGGPRKEARSLLGWVWW